MKEKKNEFEVRSNKTFLLEYKKDSAAKLIQLNRAAPPKTQKDLVFWNFLSVTKQLGKISTSS